MFNFFKKKKPPDRFPPVPDWKPSIVQPLERITDRMTYYLDGKRDFAVFRNGTCVILPDGLTDAAAQTHANEVLSRVFNFHADMNPLNMDDGNILVQYNHPAANVVLKDVVQSNWAVINAHHLRALATHEVLLTPGGPNVFDDAEKAALFGRCFMFMDAQDPQVVRIVRKSA